MGAVTFLPVFAADRLPEWTLVPYLGLLLLWVLTGGLATATTWYSRASDIELGPNGMHVVAGPARVRDLDLEGLRTAQVRNIGDLFTLTADGRVIAFTFHDAEAESFEALATTMRAGSTQRQASSTAPHTYRCVGCGSPLAASTNGTCAQCGRAVWLPPEVGDTVALPQHTERLDGLVDALLHWPQATTVHTAQLGAVFMAWVAWPAAAVMALGMLIQGGFATLDFATLFAVAWNSTITLSLHSLTLTRRRRAFELVAARFAPAPPVAVGAPARCRSCGAPLPDRAFDTPVVLCCGHCDTDHVMGVGLLQEAVDTRQSTEQLSSLVAEQTAALRKARLRTLLSATLLVATPLVLLDLLQGF